MSKTKNTPNTVRNAAMHQISGPDGLLSKRIPFVNTTGSLYAYLQRDGKYVVYSYGTCIAVIGSRGRQILNITKYSVTTSRHQSAVAAWSPSNGRPAKRVKLGMGASYVHLLQAAR